MASYNGYTNWATWNVGLWVDNDESLYNKKERLVRREGEDLKTSHIKSFVLEAYPNGTPDMATEGGVACYDSVNWKELTDEWREEPEPEEVEPATKFVVGDKVTFTPDADT